MKRKYYLRGLGIGIFLTALILGISFSNRKEISDEEVIKRAKELGLVESTYLNNMATKPESESEQESEPEQESKAEEVAGMEEPVETEPIKETETQPAKEPETEPSNTEPSNTEPSNTEPEETVTDEPVATEEEFVTLEIVRGDSSTKVAQKLEELGLIEDYKAFDRFLSENGYDKKIKAKTYQISKNVTEEEIAKTITK